MTDGGPSVDPRWVGSGWTIFNNKGKPVRQYEPFFSASFDFEFDAIHGVSPTSVYDPGRARHRHASPESHLREGGLRSLAADAGMSTTPSCSIPGPIPTSAEYFARLPESDYLPTWYQERIDGLGVRAEQVAAVEGR